MRVLECVAIYTALVWSPAVTGQLTDECSESLKASSTQNIYTEPYHLSNSITIYSRRDLHTAL